MELVLPKNHVELEQEEMMYNEGGLGVASAIALLLAWTGSGYAVTYEAGKYTHNQGWARNGAAKQGFRAAAISLYGVFSQTYFDIRFDNGWVDARNAAR